jgi:hypothetical protein
VKTLLDMLTEEALSASNIPATPLNIATGAVDSLNVVSRPNASGKTLEMWMPGDPFTDDYYFGGYPVQTSGIINGVKI